MKNLNNKISSKMQGRIRFLAFAFAALVAVCCASVCATGCGATDITTINKVTNSMYLAEVNTIAKDVNAQLSSFSQYVKDKDVDAMNTAHDNIQSTIETLSSTTVPEEMVDIHNSYMGAFVQLQCALNDYIQVYSDLKTGAQTTDVLAQRINTVQNEYNQGITLMQQAEQKAAQAA